MITGVIITYNEEDHIAACLDSLHTAVDEIVVVDAESTDDTVKIARQAGARVDIRKWKGYGDTRNYGASLARNDWILSLDADERCTPEMCREICNVLLDERIVYAFRRINMYRGRKMKNGLLKPEWKERLYNKSIVSWSLRKVHERLECQDAFNTKKLSGDLIHYGFSDLDDMMAKFDHYAQLTAGIWEDQGYKPNSIVRSLGPYYHFVKAHFLQLGILEGRDGLDLSKAAYFYSRQKYFYDGENN